MPRASDCRASSDVIKFEISTTSGIIALVNLQAQIDGLQRQATAGGLPAVSDRVELIELVALRGQILGRIDDYEWAEERAEQLACDAPEDAAAFLARARARGRLHRFTDSLADLDEGQRLGADPAVVDAERAGVFQAVGRYESALTIYTKAAKRRADFASLGALAMLHADRGEVAAAEQLFDESRDLYRGVSPFPVALLDFQRGHMWMIHEDLNRARAWFVEACRLLPCFAPANGHLAEVEAALGETQAVDRLRQLADRSDDPDYAAALARILREIGRLEEAETWRAAAEARYEELVSSHCEAFADHAASFLLETGGDPFRALSLAQRNLEVRQTARAINLHERAARACEQVGGSTVTAVGAVRLRQ
jgi:tetratricopeptide (TPR) repeat protein